MKYFVLFVILGVCAPASGSGHSYNYNKKVKPKISVDEAIKMTVELLKKRGHEKRFYFTGARLSGGPRYNGDGAWNIRLSDKEGQSVSAWFNLSK